MNKKLSIQKELISKNRCQVEHWKRVWTDTVRILINFQFVALNDKEILAQALVFLIAGFETTSVLMSFFFYVMATEPVVQEKVYEEIQREIGDVS